MTDFEIRTERLQKYLTENNIDAAIITSNPGLIYYVGRVMYSYYYVPNKGKAQLFVKMPAGLTDCTYFKSPKQLPSLIEEAGYSVPKTILLENGNISADEYIMLTKILGAKGVDGTSFFRTQRSIKSENELEILKKTAVVHCEAYKQIPSLYKKKMTDTELSIAIEAELRKMGHLGIFRTYGFRMEAFVGSVLAGENAAYPASMDFALGGLGTPTTALGACGKAMEEGTSVIVDLSNNLGGYITDLSRTFSIGKLTDEAYAMHEVSIEIQKVLEREAKAGVRACDLYEMAVNIAKAHGFEERFMGREQKAKFVGHGLGIEINEPPVIAPRVETVLEESMAIALEPKFIADGVGAVGTENTFVVRSNGLERLTNMPEEIIDLLN